MEILLKNISTVNSNAKMNPSGSRPLNKAVVESKAIQRKLRKGATVVAAKVILHKASLGALNNIVLEGLRPSIRHYINYRKRNLASNS